MPQKPLLNFDFAPVFHFTLFTVLNTPPNFLWQQFLEDTFPGQLVSKEGKTALNKQNTAIKFALDQSLGAVVNTLLFIAGIGAIKGKDSATIMNDCQRDLGTIMASGLKLWPAVSLLNFIVVPVDKRLLVGSLVGVFWNIYLSLMAA